MSGNGQARVWQNWQDMPDGDEKRHAYYASREWALLKQQVHARSGGVCERCKGRWARQVHHLTYIRLYRERLDDLLHICGLCHEYISGKRSRDPILDCPVKFVGQVVKTVYLAGKITGTKWRDQIAPGWSFENHGLPSGEIAEYGEWETMQDAIPIPDGRKLAMTGPWWRGPEWGGHSVMCGPTAGVLHAMGYQEEPEWRGHTQYELPSEVVATGQWEIYEMVRKAIAGSDMIFAWIDSLDCFGTLTEVGIARGMEKTVITAHPETGFDPTEVWLGIICGSVQIAAESPAAAWSKVCAMMT